MPNEEDYTDYTWPDNNDEVDTSEAGNVSNPFFVDSSDYTLTEAQRQAAITEGQAGGGGLDQASTFTGNRSARDARSAGNLFTGNQAGTVFGGAETDPDDPNNYGYDFTGSQANSGLGAIGKTNDSRFRGEAYGDKAPSGFWENALDKITGKIKKEFTTSDGSIDWDALMKLGARVGLGVKGYNDAVDHNKMLQQEPLRPDQIVSAKFNPYIRGKQAYAAGGIIGMGTGDFVIAADAVSGLGNGNTAAGFEVLRKMLGPVQMLAGNTDGMADKLEANIDGRQDAAVAHGEVIVPAALVKRIGGGDADKGTQYLYALMDKVRKERTGTTEQGKQIDPEKTVHSATGGGIAALAAGGAVKHFADGGTEISTITHRPDAWVGSALKDTLTSAINNGNRVFDPTTVAGAAGLSDAQKDAIAAAKKIGTDGVAADSTDITGSTIAAQQAAAASADSSGYDYVKGNTAQQADATKATTSKYTAAMAQVAAAQQAAKATSQGYNATMAQIANAGASRDATSQGYTAAMSEAAQDNRDPAANLIKHQMGKVADTTSNRFIDDGSAAAYMSPYMSNVVAMQQRDAQRQADIASTTRQGLQTKQGAFGGSRGAIMDSEAARALALQKGDINTTGLQSAYDRGAAQYNTDQSRNLASQQSNQSTAFNTGAKNLDATLGVQALGADLQTRYGLANLANRQSSVLGNQNATNAASAFTSDAANRAGIANADSANRMAQYNAGLQQQAYLGNQTASNAASAFGANASNAAEISNATSANQLAQANAALQQQAYLGNQTATNKASEYGATADNTTSQFNATAADKVKATNAGFQQTTYGLDQAANNRALEFGADAGNRAAIANAGNATSASIAAAAEANRVAGLNQANATEVGKANQSADNLVKLAQADDYRASIDSLLGVGGVQQKTTQGGLDATANLATAKDSFAGKNISSVADTAKTLGATTLSGTQTTGTLLNPLNAGIDASGAIPKATGGSVHLAAGGIAAIPQMPAQPTTQAGVAAIPQQPAATTPNIPAKAPETSPGRGLPPDLVQLLKQQKAAKELRRAQNAVLLAQNKGNPGTVAAQIDAEGQQLADQIRAPKGLDALSAQLPEKQGEVLHAARGGIVAFGAGGAYGPEDPEMYTDEEGNRLPRTASDRARVEVANQKLEEKAKRDRYYQAVDNRLAAEDSGLAQRMRDYPPLTRHAGNVEPLQPTLQRPMHPSSVVPTDTPAGGLDALQADTARRGSSAPSAAAADTDNLKKMIMDGLREKYAKPESYGTAMGPANDAYNKALDQQRADTVASQAKYADSQKMDWARYASMFDPKNPITGGGVGKQMVAHRDANAKQAVLNATGLRDLDAARATHALNFAGAGYTANKADAASEQDFGSKRLGNAITYEDSRAKTAAMLEANRNTVNASLQNHKDNVERLNYDKAANTDIKADEHLRKIVNDAHTHAVQAMKASTLLEETPAWNSMYNAKVKAYLQSVPGFMQAMEKKGTPMQGDQQGDQQLTPAQEAARQKALKG